MALPRVLLVEDDAAVRRFVEMALDGLPIELCVCASVDSALPVLQAAPVRLLITDLMMPGVSGLDLLQRLQAEPALRGGARLVAFSAGLDAAMRARLQALDVWRTLSKPTSLSELEACVMDGVAADAAAPPPETAASTPPAGEAAAVATHFGGNAQLFHAFKASCAAQFAQDVTEVDAAIRVQDAATLRRQMHSLKSVLSTLGQDGAAASARLVEAAALAVRWDEVAGPWTALRADLLALSAAA